MADYNPFQNADDDVRDVAIVVVLIVAALVGTALWHGYHVLTTPTVSGIQHAALPCLVIRCPLSQLIATIKQKLAK